jgi:hypothetical protein
MHAIDQTGRSPESGTLSSRSESSPSGSFGTGLRHVSKRRCSKRRLVEASAATAKEKDEL